MQYFSKKNYIFLRYIRKNFKYRRFLRFFSEFLCYSSVISRNLCYSADTLRIEHSIKANEQKKGKKPLPTIKKR